ALRTGHNWGGSSVTPAPAAGAAGGGDGEYERNTKKRKRHPEVPMATDYDTPRKVDEDLGEDSLEELKARRADRQGGTFDGDEADLAESFELPGADLSNEE